MHRTHAASTAPNLAEQLLKPANRLSLFLNLSVVGFILATQFQMLVAILGRAYFGMSLLLIASTAAGWILGGPRTDDRKALALTTSLRNVGVGLVIATSGFPRSPAVSAVLAYGLFEILGSVVQAIWWGRCASVERPKIATPDNPFVGAATRRRLP